MNPKNALFLSASLTAFVVAVLFGVVTKVTNSSPQVAAAAPAAQVVAAQNTAASQPTDLPEATAQVPPTPDEAAALAAAAINRKDVYSVESSSYQGVQGYKVVFSSGDVVYIGLDKQVLGKTKLQPAVVSLDPTQAPRKQHRKTSGNDNNTQPKPPAPPPGGGDDHGDDGNDH